MSIQKMDEAIYTSEVNDGTNRDEVGVIEIVSFIHVVGLHQTFLTQSFQLFIFLFCRHAVLTEVIHQEHEM